MVDKTIFVRQKQSLDRALISMGGWLRGNDAQVVSNNRAYSATEYSADSFTLNRPARFALEIPEWTYANNIGVHSSKEAGAETWYSTLKQFFGAWYPRDNWRQLGLDLPESPSARLLFGDAALNLNHTFSRYSSGSPLVSSSALWIAKQQHFLQTASPDNLSRIWSTSYKFSTALAVLLPVAINVIQAPVALKLSAQASHWVESKNVSKNIGNLNSVPIPKATPAVAPVQGVRKLSKPTGKIANIQIYILPAKGDFTSGFGWRWGRIHRGIDIAGPVGTPVVAAASGKVVTAGWGEDGFGNKVEIKHPDGTITLYAHNSRVVTKVGAQVRQGEQIAEIGSTGNSTGPHVHFQIHPTGKDAVNPMFFFGNRLKPAPAE